MNATLDSTAAALELHRGEALPTAYSDTLAPIEGVMIGLLTGSLLWLALASFVFALLRGARLFAF